MHCLKQFPAYLNRWDSQQARNEGESLCALILPFMGAGMPKALFSVTCGSALSPLWRPVRRDARQQSVSEVSVASAVKWLQRWYQQRSAAPKPRGGSVSAVGRVRGRDFDLDRPTAGPDLGRNGCRTAASDGSKPAAARSGVFSTDTTSRSKSAASSRTAASRCGASAPPLDTRARYA